MDSRYKLNMVSGMDDIRKPPFSFIDKQRCRLCRHAVKDFPLTVHPDAHACSGTSQHILKAVAVHHQKIHHRKAPAPE